MNLQISTPPLVDIAGVARNVAVEKLGETRRRLTVAAPFFEREPRARETILAGDERVTVATVSWDKYKQTATIEGDVTNG